MFGVHNLLYLGPLAYYSICIREPNFFFLRCLGVWQNVEILQNAGIMQLIRPLLLDIVPHIQQTACATLTRLAAMNITLAESMVNESIILQLILSLR